ncbi:hypothetical protein SDC9_179597 [bioreactor metagenome]|uniref:GDT1 family protein n=1 Tax=bioreactor metagenome TaxID=1076179 RepID=A0A645GZ84_9ZZZZ
MAAATLLTGIAMGIAMLGGTVVANRFIKKLDRNKFQTYVAMLLCIVGVSMVIMGA